MVPDANHTTNTKTTELLIPVVSLEAVRIQKKKVSTPAESTVKRSLDMRVHVNTGKKIFFCSVPKQDETYLIFLATCRPNEPMIYILPS